MLKDGSTKVNYQSFTQINDDDDVVINVVPQSGDSVSLWRHYINDLDFFFKKIYKYHQYGGFNAIVVRYITQLIQFAFVVCLTFVMINVVNYDVIHDIEVRNRTLLDIFKPRDQIYLHSWQYPILFIIIVSFIWRTIKLARKGLIYFAIKQFYAEALRIKDCNLFTWQEIQTRLIEAERVCLLQGKSLTELDVHNRLLRRKNYLIALVNKQLLPIYYRIPFVGEVIYFPKGLLYCFQLLLFKAPGFKLFETRWKLKDEYKQFSKREECAARFRRNCLLLSVIMGIFGIFFSFWQLLNTLYTYADEVKSNPERVFAFRTWSNYSKYYCRHFNELDHSLEDRMNKAYKPANKYMNSFISMPLESVAKLVRYMLRAMLACISVLTLVADHLLQLEHTITLISVLVFLSFACESFIRGDIPLRYNQTELYQHVLEHVHYFPSKHLPSTLQARSEFSLLFKYRIIIIVEELLSPIVSPYILYRHMSNKSFDIVDFFRNCTIEIPSIGDVCSFAMMNIEKNGNPSLRREFEGRHQSGPPFTGGDHNTNTNRNNQATSSNGDKPSPSGVEQRSFINRGDSYNLKVVEDIENFGDLKSKPAIPTENGKLELSLINFKCSNPSWKPYDSQESFIKNWNDKLMKCSKELAASSSQQMPPPTSTYVNVETTNNALNASILPRTPYSSFINSDYSSQIHPTESSQQTMAISSLLHNRLSELVSSRSGRSTSDKTENQPLLCSQSLPMTTYSSNMQVEKEEKDEDENSRKRRSGSD